MSELSNLLTWIQVVRQDVKSLKGPLEDGSYAWDTTLPNQSEIEDRVDAFDSQAVVDYFILDNVNLDGRQIRMALIAEGITLTEVQNAIDSLTEPSKSLTQVSWDYGTVFTHQDPLIQAIIALLGLTETQVDSIFRAGEFF